MTQPVVTAAMIQAAREAAFTYLHPGKKKTDVAWVAPPIGLVKAMLTTALMQTEDWPMPEMTAHGEWTDDRYTVGVEVVVEFDVGRAKLASQALMEQFAEDFARDILKLMAAPEPDKVHLDDRMTLNVNVSTNARATRDETR